jgi:hypothetical protein
MRARCHCSTKQDYAEYGGRGITVCERWQSFENFLADMGPRPSPKHSIDRINNNGNYEPSNCRWATAKEQVANRRPNRKRLYKVNIENKRLQKVLLLAAELLRSWEIHESGEPLSDVPLAVAKILFGDDTASLIIHQTMQQIPHVTDVAPTGA